MKKRRKLEGRRWRGKKVKFKREEKLKLMKVMKGIYQGERK